MCSPVLKSIFQCSDVRVNNGGSALTVSIPEFHPESIKTLLLFLYSGEVCKIINTCPIFKFSDCISLFSFTALRKGSRTLMEFKELCNVLKINPPVNKYRTTTATTAAKNNEKDTRHKGGYD